MQMSLWGLEVDGTLANPIVARAALIWCICLFPLSLLLAYRSARAYLSPTGPAQRFKLLAPIVGLVILLAASPLPQFLIANRLYKLENPNIISVGLWGGPPLWPALASVTFASVIGCLAAWRQARVVSSAV